MINVGDLVYETCDRQKTIGLVRKALHGRWLVQFMNGRKVWLFAKDLKKIDD